ncbi:glutathione S-transferase family protein [Psychromarinibacter sp. S121]|uniref:glutathione S-transferase family protein n=1 Tax=Psychromarinibacter sp. S121 TaxID=3415127 RepID=UPI003C7E4831
MYTVIGSVRSRALRVLWMLEEIGQRYDRIDAGPQSEEARRHNPSGKIPVLLVDGAAVTDSTAILQFLADRHNALTFPPGTLERARQDGATHFVLDEMDALLWTAARHSFALPEEHRVPEVKESLRWEYTRSLDRLAARIAGPFLMGDTMTVPDIVAAHCLSWARAAKFPEPDGAVADYRDMMLGRPAFRRALGS